MKFFRVLASGVLLLFAAVGAAVWYAAQHENQLVNLVLAQISKRTGLQIEPSRTRLGLGTRLVVVLERPRVMIDHREAARLEGIRAVFSYWALLHRTGLPLYGLVFSRGTINVPHQPEELPASSLTANGLNTLTHYLGISSSISRRFDLVDITLVGQDHRPLAEHLNAVAYQPHYRGGPWPWIVKFDAQAGESSIAGAQFAGNLQLGAGRDRPGVPVDGQLWFWELPLRHIRLADFNVSAQVDGDVKLAVSANAQTAGNFTLTMRDLLVGGPAVNGSLMLGSFSSRGHYRLSQTQAELSNFEVDHEQSPVLQARVTVLNPYSSSRTVTFAASGIRLALAYLANWLRSLRVVPPPVLHAAERIRSGILMVNRVALKMPESLDKLNLQKIARESEINAALTRFSYAPPPDLGLPPVYQFDAQMTYSGGVARLRQTTAQIGGSSFSDIRLDLDLLKAPEKIGYRLKLTSWLDAGEVYGATHAVIEQAQPKLRGQLLWVHGHTSVQLQANGTVNGLRMTIPPDYRVTANFGDVEFQLNKMPAAIWLNHGSVVLEPGRISLNQIVAIPLGETGNVVLNGIVLTDTTPVQIRNLTAELHQLSSAKWVPLIVGPNQTAVSGPISGKLVVNSKAGFEFSTVVGKLTLDNGTVQPGFLRSPIVVIHSATITLDGTGVILEIRAARLEGQPLDFRMAVADLNHPQVRIDAKVTNLDFEVMRFIRLPWSPSSPPQFFPVPVSGHIEAQAGNFDKLAMSNISVDFHHNSQIWRVDKFRATAFNGSIDLTISGRARDNWMNMKGVIAHMDAGPLFLLSGTSHQVPILGTLSAAGDLWANTNTDFFRTLTGRISITMTNGVLNRFTLLKRILSLVNLKNWLTAQFPDPREAGVPFTRLAADFRANKGNLYTDNLRMNGPVIDITARGDIDVGNSTMNMEIVLLALQTVNWLLDNIPIIGKHLGGATKQLVGAYFQVSGPISNPSIWPKPLTSVAKFVLRTLSLPINIIAPNTIQ
jgi:AsmA-like C-terminal region